MQLLVIQVKISHMFKNIKIFLFIIKWSKVICCYNSHDVLYGGCIYSLYGDVSLIIIKIIII